MPLIRGATLLPGRFPLSRPSRISGFFPTAIKNGAGRFRRRFSAFVDIDVLPDFDTTGLFGIRFGNDDLEDAFLARCRDLFAIDTVWQCKAPHEDAM